MLSAHTVGLFLAVFAVSVSAQTARALPGSLPRQDLWANGACRHNPEAPGPDVNRTMFSYNVKIEDDVAAHSSSLRSDIDAAYAYADAHCFALELADPDEALERGHFQDAFKGYRDYFFPPGGGRQSLNPMYDAVGAIDPFKSGLTAAAEDHYRTATAFFKESIERAPDFQPAHYLLGNVYFAEGRRADARREWLAVLASYGDLVPEKEDFGPDPPWLSALRMYEMHR